ncbi:MAG TPA: hypothetical protein VFS35_07995, partial [Terrimicrobiaceae bacterium]|nr:hypothetical protein [Terrimicrobiaceae bacterium]
MASEKYPQTIYLQQISGVGPITQRFRRTRDIGGLLWVCVLNDIKAEKPTKSCESAKCGDHYLRRLLMGAAQHILG